MIELIKSQMPQADFDFVSPPEIIGTVTSFFGGQIDLDPASSHAANTLVNAYKYFTPADNGLKQKWKAKSVYLYPPRELLTSGEQPEDFMLFRRKRRFQKSAQRVWLEECYRKYIRKEFNEAIVFLTSSEVALLTTQALNIDFPLCILKTRPALLMDEPGLSKVKNSRCYGFIYYFPDYENMNERVVKFNESFSSLGRVYY
jgi:hypothetical protein